MSKGDYQVRRNGPLTPDVVQFLHDVRLKQGWSYAALGERLGISPAFTHAILNKGMNLSTDTFMTKVAEGIDALKNGSMEPRANEVTPGKPQLLEHFYHLRDGVQVTLKLPADLTDREAERLSQFIRSLAR